MDNLTQWEKLSFNTMILLLSAILGVGIGFLLDQIGLLARGTILQSKSYSVKEVCTSVPVTVPHIYVGTPIDISRI